MVESTDRTSEETRKRLLVRTFIFLGVLALLFYIFSGAEAWPAARVYVALLAVMGLGTGSCFYAVILALLAERMRSPIQKEQKAWDKVLIGVLLLLYVGWFVLIELDAERFHWSSVPAVSSSHRGDPDLCHPLHQVARHAGEQLRRSGREDTEGARPQGRDHGALRLRASPDVCGAIPFLIGTPLLLGSWWGLLFSPLLIAVLAIRAVLEEQTLKAELEGYAEYAKRVRYRFVPYIW